LGVHVVGNNLFFFHEACGIKSLEIGEKSLAIIFEEVQSWLK
jgi:hypothetical protein